DARRSPIGVEPEGAGPARTSTRGRRRSADRRRAPRPRLGRVRRLVQRSGQGDDQPPSAQARRPARDRDRPPRRLPDQRMNRFDRRLTTQWIRSRLPARTIRLRLTALYGALFLVSGAALLAITYALAAHHYSSGFFIVNGQKGVIAARVAKVT